MCQNLTGMIYLQFLWAQCFFLKTNKTSFASYFYINRADQILTYEDQMLPDAYLAPSYLIATINKICTANPVLEGYAICTQV